MSRKTHFILQLCLVVIWLLILWANNAVTVSSQTPHCPQPPYWNTNPLRKFWRKDFGPVIVKIDSRFNNQYEWALDAKDRIKAGQEKWNSLELCTGVKFTDFGLKDFTPAELTDESPSAHVYWVFGQPPVASWNADTLVYIGENEHVIAAKDNGEA